MMHISQDAPVLGGYARETARKVGENEVCRFGRRGYLTVRSIQGAVKKAAEETNA